MSSEKPIIQPAKDIPFDALEFLIRQRGKSLQHLSGDFSLECVAGDSIYTEQQLRRLREERKSTYAYFLTDHRNQTDISERASSLRNFIEQFRVGEYASLFDFNSENPFRSQWILFTEQSD